MSPDRFDVDALMTHEGLVRGLARSILHGGQPDAPPDAPPPLPLTFEGPGLPDDTRRR